jgi:penicillin amidase
MRWDAPIVDESGLPATIPSSDVYDLRSLSRDLFSAEAGSILEQRLPAGSNNWAVAGSRTATGRALIANDIHLDLGVPSIWFRVSLERGDRSATGAILPGIPAIVAGSNGRVAWGLTNSFGDWIDMIVLELDLEDPSRYRTPDGWMPFETVSSPIEVAGQEDRDLAVRRTIWGPVLGELPDGRPYVGRWVAHSPRGYALDFMGLPDAVEYRSSEYQVPLTWCSLSASVIGLRLDGAHERSPPFAYFCLSSP